MNIELLQTICRELPAVTEDIKWGHDLCFCVGGKMFLVVGLNENPVSASFKVPDEDFEEISCREGFQPAPYVARYKWVKVDRLDRITPRDWTRYIRQSYKLVGSKLPSRKKKELGITSQ